MNVACAPSSSSARSRSRLAAVVLTTLAVASLAVGAVGCSSSNKDPGLAANTGTQAAENNPYGVAYPTQNLGTQKRLGNTPGSVMTNYHFVGYAHHEPGSVVPTGGELQNVSLADFYDPEMRKFKVIHISVAAVWCGPCNEETDETVPVAEELLAKGIVFVQALSDGPVDGRGATKKDLDGWILKHKSNFTELLDPDLKNFGKFFNAAAVPWNANIDARTMEILSAGVGAPQKGVKGDTEQWLTWVESNPPSYQQ
ncbi:MAG: hypothetical protein JWM74_3786 [Myxococcaceae bacterium]|nr:hypothetical protein [Myxococcaceae bacterium]